MSIRDFVAELNLPREEAIVVLDEQVNECEEIILSHNESTLQATIDVVQTAASNLERRAPKLGYRKLLSLVCARIGKARGQETPSRFVRLTLGALKAIFDAGYSKPDEVKRMVDKWGIEHATNHALSLQPAWNLIPTLQTCGVLNKAKRTDAEKYVRGQFGKIVGGTEGVRKLINWVAGFELSIEQHKEFMEDLKEWRKDRDVAPAPTLPSPHQTKIQPKAKVVVKAKPKTTTSQPAPRLVKRAAA